MKVTGIALLVVALGMLLLNVSDTVSDLKQWHDATTPQFVGPLLKQIGAVLTAAVGGTLIPAPALGPKGDQ